jgi:hypothetical protein
LSRRHSTYFERYAWPQRLFEEFQPPDDLQAVVIIPSYKEESLNEAVRSLISCDPFPEGILFLVVINESENETDEITKINEASLRTLEDEFGHRKDILVSYVKLPQKKAGVGLARKIGMDEAAYWFYELQRDGIIICFDADSTCAPNYLQTIIDAYLDFNVKSGIVHYEHPLNLESGIIAYELHLRYYCDALRYAGFPYAFQTLGSCITVRASTYMQEGGMNTRKAGEDFYFLHKVIPKGGFREIDTTVYPSDRVSDRVPFGTGKALSQYRRDKTYLTNNHSIFKLIKNFISTPEKYMMNNEYPIDQAILPFLEQNEFHIAIQKCQKQSVDVVSFRKLFFEWMDGFRILKLVHFLRDHHAPNAPLNEQLEWLNKNYWMIGGFSTDPIVQLKAIRQHNRSNKYAQSLF